MSRGTNSHKKEDINTGSVDVVKIDKNSTDEWRAICNNIEQEFWRTASRQQLEITHVFEVQSARKRRTRRKKSVVHHGNIFN